MSNTDLNQLVEELNGMPLDAGFSLRVRATGFGIGRWEFRALNSQALPMDYWVQVTIPQHGAAATMTLGTPYQGSAMDAGRGRVYAEVLHHAATFVDAANEGLQERLAEQRKREEQRLKEEKERRERERAEVEERAKGYNAWVAEMQEALQWHLGERFRLLRWNMRATVFGTLENVAVNESRSTWHPENRGYLELTTEKGKYMRLSFDELEIMEKRDEDERAYIPITLADHPWRDKPERRERRTITGGNGSLKRATEIIES